MTTVRATCLLCEKAVEVSPHEVVLHLGGSEVSAYRYGFTCPSCTVFIVRPAGPAVVEALLATDVELSTGHLPPWEQAQRPSVVLVDAGPHIEHIGQPSAPALTEADAVAFAASLDDDSALTAWLTD